MALFILPASCVTATVECNDTQVVMIGGSDGLLYFLAAIAALAVIAAVGFIVVQRRRRR